jgi:hypothetical protein
MVKLGQVRIICLQRRLHRDKKRHEVGATRGVQQDISTLLKPDIITLPRQSFCRDIILPRIILPRLSRQSRNVLIPAI